MAKEKLIPEPPHKDDGGTPREKFDGLALKVFSVPKSEIDKREKQWKKDRERESSEPG